MRKDLQIRSKFGPKLVERQSGHMWRSPTWFFFWQFTQRWREFKHPNDKEKQ